MKNKIESKPTCICDLCSLGILQDKSCYVGVKECLKNGIYAKFRNRELEAKDKALDKACDMLSKMREATDCWEFNECPFREECSKNSEMNAKGPCYNKDKWREVFKDE